MEYNLKKMIVVSTKDVYFDDIKFLTKDRAYLLSQAGIIFDTGVFNEVFQILVEDMFGNYLDNYLDRWLAYHFGHTGIPSNKWNVFLTLDDYVSKFDNNIDYSNIDNSIKSIKDVDNDEFITNYNIKSHIYNNIKQGFFIKGHSRTMLVKNG